MTQPLYNDLHVLVEFPDDTSYFEENDIGYPSFESEDNGARYVPQRDYIEHFKKDPAPNSCFRPLCWPESQSYLPGGDADSDSADDSIKALNECINDEKGLADFGPNSVWVPLCNLPDDTMVYMPPQSERPELPHSPKQYLTAMTFRLGNIMGLIIGYNGKERFSQRQHKIIADRAARIEAVCRDLDALDQEPDAKR